MIIVEHLIVTLMGCVRTFSYLQKETSGLRSRDGMSTMDRLKWAQKGDIISEVLRRLQEHKPSLTLMLIILQW